MICSTVLLEEYNRLRLDYDGMIYFRDDPRPDEDMEKLEVQLDNTADRIEVVSMQIVIVARIEGLPDDVIDDMLLW
jgi:hypothetical protein